MFLYSRCFFRIFQLYEVFHQRGQAARQSHLASRTASLAAVSSTLPSSTSSSSSSVSASTSSSSSTSSPGPVVAPAAAAAAEVLMIGKENTIDNIAVDLERTFPTLAFFQQAGPMNEQLRILLETYCFYRPDVGYVQGMSYLAGHLLLYLEPYTAFVCFANLLNSAYFLAFLKMDRDAMQARYRIFAQLFEQNVPQLYRSVVFVFQSRALIGRMTLCVFI